MKAWASRLQTIGDVQCFDYDYMSSGKKAPDQHKKLVACHRSQIVQTFLKILCSFLKEKIQSSFPGRRIFLIGKSMGSRIGLHAAIEEGTNSVIDGCICLGYPLRGINGAVRDEVLLELQHPVLFVSGTRDKLCPLDLLKKVQCM